MDPIPRFWLICLFYFMRIDFRSDTVTLPTPGMREAMMNASVGDDVFGEDPSIIELESMSAKMFGMEAALFCTSGTMSNQVAIKAHTQPGDEVICERQAHAYIYEVGGIAFNSGAQVRALEGERGRLHADQILCSINPDDVHKARTSLVCLENTSNRGGGSCYSFDSIEEIRKICLDHGLQFHLDGARLFNALVAKKETPKQYGTVFDSISFCLNKGLGCPIGSVLVGNRNFILKARRIRKVFGGGMRQGGFMAAAGIYALKNQVDRLAKDHSNARILYEELSKKQFVKSIMPVETNIVILETLKDFPAQKLATQLRDRDLLSIAIAPHQLRFVTHLDVTDEMMERAVDIIKKL